jgi:hypothetical protein
LRAVAIQKCKRNKQDRITIATQRQFEYQQTYEGKTIERLTRCPNTSPLSFAEHRNTANATQTSRKPVAPSKDRGALSDGPYRYRHFENVISVPVYLCIDFPKQCLFQPGSQITIKRNAKHFSQQSKGSLSVAGDPGPGRVPMPHRIPQGSSFACALLFTTNASRVVGKILFVLLAGQIGFYNFAKHLKI